MKGIEIPFGAKDSELCGWEYTIPEGMEAVVKDGKVIVRRKESEEERIRKAALEGIEYLEHKLGWDFIGDTDILDVKEYLERQKEQKPVARKSDFVSKPRTSVEILRHYLVWAENSEEDCPYTWKTLADAISDGIKALEEQKPEEKQEYSGLNDLERAIHRGFLSAGVKNVPVTIIKETAQECISQMKPAEWSEEDEKMRSNLMSLLANMRGDRITEETYQKYYPWLKALRPSWKPSKEQISDLWRAATMNTITCPTLKSLYNDLKELM